MQTFKSINPLKVVVKLLSYCQLVSCVSFWYVNFSSQEGTVERHRSYSSSDSVRGGRSIEAEEVPPQKKKTG